MAFKGKRCGNMLMQLGGEFLFVWLGLKSHGIKQIVQACTSSLGFQNAAGVSAREFTTYLVHNLRGKCK